MDRLLRHAGQPGAMFHDAFIDLLFRLRLMDDRGTWEVRSPFRG
jgi:hypothetical protein